MKHDEHTGTPRCVTELIKVRHRMRCPPCSSALENYLPELPFDTAKGTVGSIHSRSFTPADGRTRWHVLSEATRNHLGER
jgi:hypothetical protein